MNKSNDVDAAPVQPIVMASAPELTLPKPYYDQDGITIYHGDCRDVLQQMEPSSVHTVVTDPPYAIQFTGHSFALLADDPVSKSWASKGVSMTHKPRGTPTLYKQVNPRCGVCGRCVNGKSTAKGFVVCECGGEELLPWPNTAMVRLHEWHMGWACEVFRVMRRGSHLWAFAASRTIGRMSCAIEDSGFEIRDLVMWKHDQGVGRNSTTFRPSFEPVIVATKPKRPGESVVDVQTGCSETNCLEFGKHGSDRTGLHPTEKPLGVMKAVLGLAVRDGGTLVDPFMGSGTTLRAAKDLGLTAIGIEVEERFCEVAANRLAQGVLF